MSQPGDGRVTVRIKVVVEGASGAALVESGRPRRKRMLSSIDKPLLAPAGTPVRQAGSTNFIDATGSASLNGKPPRVVWAKVFSDTGVSATSFPGPDCGAQCLSAPGGTWSFTAANGNDLPGAACDPSNVTGPANNTLLLWYDFSDQPGQGFQTDVRAFHAFCPGASGSGSGPGSSLVAFGARQVPARLVATFTGALTPLGSVPLAWTGSGWASTESGVLVAFLFADPETALLSGAPPLAFSVVGKPTSYHPFLWSAAGTCQGEVVGSFSVNVTE